MHHPVLLEACDNCVLFGGRDTGDSFMLFGCRSAECSMALGIFSSIPSVTQVRRFNTSAARNGIPCPVLHAKEHGKTVTAPQFQPKHKRTHKGPRCAFCVFARSSIHYYVPAKVQSTATTNILPGPVAFSKCRGESDVSIELRFPDQSTSYSASTNAKPCVEQEQRSNRRRRLESQSDEHRLLAGEHEVCVCVSW